jgi:hypothetical protein
MVIVVGESNIFIQNNTVTVVGCVACTGSTNKNFEFSFFFYIPIEKRSLKIESRLQMRDKIELSVRTEGELCWTDLMR